MRTFLFTTLAGAAIAAGFALTSSSAAPPAAPAALTAAPAAPVPPPVAPARLVAHEWGTFTSFSGSDGVAVGFTPNYTDLPRFVYQAPGPETGGKGGRLRRGGLISMETPVIYFYTDRETRVTVDVKFPRGWITEWYPQAHTLP